MSPPAQSGRNELGTTFIFLKSLRRSAAQTAQRAVPATLTHTRIHLDLPAIRWVAR